MSYAIIGAGHVGLALAGLFARKSLNVSIASRRPPRAVAPLVRELGASVRAVPLEEGLQAEIIFLAIPWPAFREFARSAAIDWRGKIVVDAMNSREDLGGRLSSEIVTEELRGARVVKAFNQLPAAVLGRDPSENGGRRVVFVSSDAQSLHRIEPASARAEVEAAGFVLDAESTMLANKDDRHSIKVFDPSIKGETDRFAYRFVKP